MKREPTVATLSSVAHPIRVCTKLSLFSSRPCLTRNHLQHTHPGLKYVALVQGADHAVPESIMRFCVWQIPHSTRHLFNRRPCPNPAQATYQPSQLFWFASAGAYKAGAYTSHSSRMLSVNPRAGHWPLAVPRCDSPRPWQPARGKTNRAKHATMHTLRDRSTQAELQCPDMHACRSWQPSRL